MNAGLFPNLSKCSKTATASEKKHSLHVPESTVGLMIGGLQAGRPERKAGPWLHTATGELQAVWAAGDAGHGETSWGIKLTVMLGGILKARVRVDGREKGSADKGEPGKSCRCFPLNTGVAEMSSRQGAPRASGRRGTEVCVNLTVCLGGRRAKSANTFFIKCFETNTSKSTTLYPADTKRRLLRVPGTARRSILNGISPECPLEGLMLKLKLQFSGHLMRRPGSFGETLMLGKTEGRRRGGDRGGDARLASPTSWT